MPKYVASVWISEFWNVDYSCFQHIKISKSWQFVVLAYAHCCVANLVGTDCGKCHYCRSDRLAHRTVLPSIQLHQATSYAYCITPGYKVWVMSHCRFDQFNCSSLHIFKKHVQCSCVPTAESCKNVCVIVCMRIYFEQNVTWSYYTLYSCNLLSGLC